MSENVTKSGFIALLGRPNAGKSTLLNALLGQKISIVSPKPQTTRTRITGVLTENGYQMIFIDTPGIHKPKTKLGDYMEDAVNRTVNDVDAGVLVIDASEKQHPAEAEIIKQLAEQKLPCILALNKTDLVEDKAKLASRIASLASLCDFCAVVPISAKEGDNIDALKSEIVKLLIDGPAFFPEDTLTDQPERTLAAELIREKLLYALDDELPHGIGVIVEQMKERADGNIIDVNATIYCEKQSHKGMVIGKGGSMLKKVGSLARRDMEQFFDCRINLKLWVKVKEDWRNREGVLHEMGYVKTK